MSKTSIEWTDHSINPIRARIGDGNGHYCEKISPGCKNCYASRLQPRFRMPVFQEQRRGGVEWYLHAKALAEVLRRRKPTRYFWCDMSDLFGWWVKNEWLAAMFGVMAATPQHTHMLLTKRPERALEWFRWLAHDTDPGLLRQHTIQSYASYELGDGSDEDQRRRLDDLWNRAQPEHTPWPLPNVWLGVSVEDQQRADERIPLLLQCPAAVRFLSVEPLLGPVDLAPYMLPTWGRRSDGLWGCNSCCNKDRECDNPQHRLRERCKACGGAGAISRVDWVIVGGESGAGARPMHPDWARSIRDQCVAAGVPFFFKQWGAWQPNGAGGMHRIGKKQAGRLLDGRTWDEMPRRDSRAALL